MSEFIFQLFDQMNIQEVGLFESFWGISNEKVYVAPRKGQEKYRQHVIQNIKTS